MSLTGIVNFALFAIKLYIGMSSGSLAIYCDSINNLADTASCILAVVCFALLYKFEEIKGARIQALCSFVIGLFVLVSGVYFIYNGAERLMYPTLTSFASKYALLIGITIIVKLVMGFVYIAVNKKYQSSVFRVLILESFLDGAVTMTALAGFLLVERVNFAVDGLFAIIIGAIITVEAVITLVRETKAIINDRF